MSAELDLSNASFPLAKGEVCGGGEGTQAGERCLCCEAGELWEQEAARLCRIIGDALDLLDHDEKHGAAAVLRTGDHRHAAPPVESLGDQLTAVASPVEDVDG